MSHLTHRCSVTRGQNIVTLETLTILSSELRELSQAPVGYSRTLLLLNELFASVENYLSERGLSFDKRGFWQKKHWAYPLLEQLSAHIQDCKDQNGQIDEALLSFVEDRLLPRLYNQALRLT